MASFFDNLEWRLIAKDDASATFKKVSDKQRELKDSSDDLADSMKKQAGGWKDIAAGVFAGGAALDIARNTFGFFKDQLLQSVQAAGDFQREQATLNAVLQSTGGIAGLTAQELNDMADSLAASTAIAGGEITKVQSMLLSFTKISKDNFDQVTQSVLDYATFMNQGGIPSTEGLKTAAIQLGKAMQDPIKGVTALSKSGVQLSDSQIELIDTFMETNDVASAQQVILDELATQTAGQAAAAAQTYEGRMARLHEALNQVREQIGMALMPTLSLFTDAIIDQTGKVRLSDEGLYKWQLRIYQGAVIIGGAIATVANFGKSLWLLVKIAAKVAAGMVTGFYEIHKALFDVGDIMKTVFQAIKDALTGDFSGALDTIKNKLSSTFSATSSVFSSMVSDVGALANQMIHNFDPMDSALDKAMNHTAFDQMVESMKNATSGAGSLGDALGDVGSASDGAASATQEDMDKIKTSYEDLKDKASEELAKLEMAHVENVDKIKAKLADLSSSLAQTTADYQKSLGEINKTEAEKVVEQEQLIQDLTSQIADIRNGADAQTGISEGDQQQLASLEEQLAKEKAAYETYIADRQGLETELAEARRRASLTAFEREMEDLNTKRAEEKAAYDEKIAQIQSEVVEQQNALAQENAVYEQKKAMYAEVDAAFTAFHDNYLANMSEMGQYTEETVTLMTAKLAEIQALLAEIQSARTEAGVSLASSAASSSSSSSSSSASSDSSQSSQAAGATVNITFGDVNVQNESDIQAIVDEITRQLQLAGLASS